MHFLDEIKSFETKTRVNSPILFGQVWCSGCIQWVVWGEGGASVEMIVIMLIVQLEP